MSILNERLIGVYIHRIRLKLIIWSLAYIERSIEGGCAGLHFGTGMCSGPFLLVMQEVFFILL